MLDVIARRLFPAVLLPLAAGGCVPFTGFDPYRVAYDLQVRGPEGVLPRASLRMVFGTRSEAVTGLTDGAGNFRTVQEVPLDFLSEKRSSAGPWLRIIIQKEGFEPLTLDLGREQFFQEGHDLRRVEAVFLRKVGS